MSGWCQTFRLRGKCSPSQHRRLTEIFGQCAELYNANLESWKGTYAWWKEHHSDTETFPSEKNLSLYDRMVVFTGVRADRPEWARLDTRVGRGVLRRFDRAVKAFCKRAGEGKAGYPRFKSSRRWRSVEIPDASASMLIAPNTRKNPSARWWKLRVKGVPRIRIEDKHDRLAAAVGLGAKVVELRVVRTPLRTEVHVVVKHPERPVPLVVPENPVGVDMGLKTRMTLSTGEHVPARTVNRTLIKRTQRKISRAEKGSRSRRKKVAAHAKAWRREKERAVQADHRIVSSHDGVATENLNTAGLLKGKRFSKKMLEQRWRAFFDTLKHQAEKAGVQHVKVNPSHTSTDCSSCGQRQAMPLNTRVYKCGECGLVMCRDRNAALNIRARGFPQWNPRGRPGLPADAARDTNLCRETDPSPGKATLTDAAKQYTSKARVATGI